MTWRRKAQTIPAHIQQEHSTIPGQLPRTPHTTVNPLGRNNTGAVSSDTDNKREIARATQSPTYAYRARMHDNYDKVRWRRGGELRRMRRRARKQTKWGRGDGKTAPWNSREVKAAGCFQYWGCAAGFD